jgi:hypothetical protein
MPGYKNSPAQVEVFFNLRDTNIATFSLAEVPVLPRTGESIYIGADDQKGGGSYDVISVRHEYVDRGGTASPMLGRITVLLKRRAAQK